MFHVVSIPNQEGSAGGSAWAGIETDYLRATHAAGGRLGILGGIAFYNYQALEAASFTGAPASIASGATIALKNNDRIRWRNAANSADIDGIYVDSSDRAHVSANAYIGGYIEGTELSAPAAPAANGFRLYAEDDGSGKTRLMAKFSSGAAQQLAIQP